MPAAGSATWFGIKRVNPMTTPAAFKPLSKNDVADILGVTARTRLQEP